MQGNSRYTVATGHTHTHIYTHTQQPQETQRPGTRQGCLLGARRGGQSAKRQADKMQGVGTACTATRQATKAKENMSQRTPGTHSPQLASPNFCCAGDAARVPAGAERRPPSCLCVATARQGFRGRALAVLRLSLCVNSEPLWRG
jgi:hypothetical protein